MPNEKPSAFAALVEGFKAVFGLDGQSQSADSTSSHPEHADTDPLLAEGQRQYNLFVGLIAGSWVVTLLLWAVPAFTSLDAWGISLGSDFTLAYGFVLWIPITVYIIASVRVVQTYERGGIMVLEKPVKEVEPGLQFVPLVVAELHTYPINPQRKQYPGEPELIFKGPDDQPLPEKGMVREIRATTHAPKEGQKMETVIVPKGGKEKVAHKLTNYYHDGDNLNVQKTIAITFFVIWKVAAGRGDFFRFYLNILGENWEDKKRFVEEQIRDSAETDLVEQIAKHTLGEVLSDIEGINKALKVRVQENLSQFGINIVEARMQNPDISKRLNDALQEIAEAKARADQAVADAKKTRTDAEAERFRLEQIGEGEAAQIRVREKAKGEGQRAAADAMSMDPAEYRAGEVAEDALANNSTFVLGAEGIADKIISAFATKKKGDAP